MDPSSHAAGASGSICGAGGGAVGASGSGSGSGMGSSSTGGKYFDVNFQYVPPTSKDPAWVWGRTKSKTDSSTVFCTLCGHKSSSGITRFKDHLLGKAGNVAACKNASEQIKKAIYDHINESASKKGKKDALSSLMQMHTTVASGLQVPHPPVEASVSRLLPRGTMDSFVRAPQDSLRQTTIDNRYKKEQRENACIAISRWMYQNGIAFNAVRSPSFQPMIDAITLCGPGMKAPSYHEIRETLLEKEVIRVNDFVNDFRKYWKTYGCSIMSDGWTDKKQRTLINFLVHCPQGTIFLKSVDASNDVKDANKLYALLKEVILEVGVDNVVQIITDNASNYVAAGRMLMGEFSHLFWTPCAAHCIDLMLEDIGKTKRLNKVFAKAKRLVTFFYSHLQVLHMMRHFTGGKDIHRPAVTRFATRFLALDSLWQCKESLRSMIFSNQWENCNWSKTSEGKQAKATILQQRFWKGVSFSLRAMGPLVDALRMVDSDEKPAMGYIYEKMDRVKEQIKVNLKHQEDKYGFICEIIDKRWNRQMRKPLHAVALYLNPGLYYDYEPGIESNAEIKGGLFQVINILARSHEDQNAICSQLAMYRTASGGFGLELAINARKTYAPGEWWTSFGYACPELQQFAIRILSLTCSSSPCERNWSTFEMVMLLVGETGCGKSTQFIQYLADSDLTKHGCVVCTQPRKIAATSLAQRVGEESYQCYGEKSVVCYPAYSSLQPLNSKIIYMTDNCLLQHFMNLSDLSGISVIVIDEAHERSLNTDLLLALVKKELLQRTELRLVIMSATADAKKLSDYFFGCETYHVIGRSYPVDIKYVPHVSPESSYNSISKDVSLSNPYVIGVVKMVNEIHKMEEDGAILAFLTSQAEIEWACENFQNPSAVALPLHGKLSPDKQNHIFQSVPHKRKVIFATNLAETSLTIPDVRYVIDSGVVKESRFDPTTGTNVLKVCKISRSSADQRAGRAGRTEAGKCYRLYSEKEFQCMSSHQDPEIRRVHLGIAVLKIVALGFTDILDFEFVDSPSPEAIELAINNLVHLGAIVRKGNIMHITDCGRYLVKLGIEPRLGKLILLSLDHGLRREGIILAAVMANASSIFCRVGSDEEKAKSDCRKLHFCHPNGDLFTLLAVYKEWEEALQSTKNKWCWENSINAKSMRRCTESALELEQCLRHELNIITPSYWVWQAHQVGKHDRSLKMILLSCLSENVAVFSGYDRIGYDVAMTGQLAQLHPSCSLLAYGEKPGWVVYGELLSISKLYLVCVTAIDSESLSLMNPPPLFDILQLSNRMLLQRIVSGLGIYVLRRFCGKSNQNLHSVVSRIQKLCGDDRIFIDVDFDKGEVQVFASSKCLDRAFAMLQKALGYESRLLKNECIEKYLFHGSHGNCPSLALVGAGAEIKHLELEKRSLTIEVSYPRCRSLDDKELLMLFDGCSSKIVNFYKYSGVTPENDNLEKWGRITFLCPEAAEKVVAEMDEVEFDGFPLSVQPLRRSLGVDPKVFLFPAVKANITWPRRQSKGVAIIRCAPHDVASVAQDCSPIRIGERYFYCDISTRFEHCAVIMGLGKDISEGEIWEALTNYTTKRILDVHLLRADVLEQPSTTACEEAIIKEINNFVPSDKCHVHVYQSEPKDYSVKALITFDGNLHLRAAMALDHLNGKALACCLPWQKIRCQRMFHSLLSCPSSIYYVIKQELDSLLEKVKVKKDVVINIDRTESGSFRVKILSPAMRTVAQTRFAFENIIKGKTISHGDLTSSVLQLLFTKEGSKLLKSLEKETGTCILFDRHNLSIRAFGPTQKIRAAENKLVESLLALHKEKGHEIPLRGPALPHNLMKEVVSRFGPDLHDLNKNMDGSVVKLNVRHHMLSFSGSKEHRLELENMIAGIVQELSGEPAKVHDEDTTCAICLHPVEDGLRLEDCGHEFCRLCLKEQIEAAIYNRDGFPLCCVREGCDRPLLIVDLKAIVSNEQLDELFRASLTYFVASSGGRYRFCPTPDCPSVYKVAGPESVGSFVCGACSSEICTKCHVEYHPYMTCERYKLFKEDPDASVKEWRTGKEYVKNCPECNLTIEKVEGCNHVECLCGKHICWVCLEGFANSDDCYTHLRVIHHSLGLNDGDFL